MSDIEFIREEKLEVLDSSQLPPEVLDSEFPYLSRPDLEQGKDSASFALYGGNYYDLGDTEGFPPFTSGWDLFISDSFFSGIVFRYGRPCNCVLIDHEDNCPKSDTPDFETVFVATYIVH